MPKGFKLYCEPCGKDHIMVQKPCPECDGRGAWTCQPKSEKVAENCKNWDYACDGCVAYRDHTRC